MGVMFACYLVFKFQLEKCRHQILVYNYRHLIILFSCSSEFNRFHRVLIELCWPTLSSTLDHCFLDAIPSFWISRVPSPPVFEVIITVLIIDTPWTVIFTLTVRKSYKSCTLLHLMSIRGTLTGLYIVRTTKMEGTITIIQVLMRDSQYFPTANHQALVLNTFDSPGILYYVGERSWKFPDWPLVDFLSKPLPNQSSCVRL